MRCPKCGRTSHDFRVTCAYCSTDFSGQAAILGVFPQRKGDFSWFVSPPGDPAGKRETSSGPGAFKPDLSSIDVSDLTIGEGSSPDPVVSFEDIEPVDLELIASDDAFQKAVTKAVGESAE